MTSAPSAALTDELGIFLNLLPQHSGRQKRSAPGQVGRSRRLFAAIGQTAVKDSTPRFDCGRQRGQGLAQLGQTLTWRTRSVLKVQCRLQHADGHTNNLANRAW